MPIMADARDWLFNHLLPLWSTEGRDRAGGFHDQLDDEGRPRDLPKRCRVQTRQVYVFAEAGRLGWTGPWRECIDHGLAFIDSAFARQDRLYRCKVDAAGAAIDDAADNYDQAFVLFALAKAYSATGDTRLASRALALLQALRRRSHPLGGFHEADPPCVPLRSNPHMHLFEAAVAWVEVAALEEFRLLAEEIAALCQSRFIDPASGALLEYFDLGWHPTDNGAGYVAEPGHQFEWAWLLLRWHALGGSVDPQVAARLYAFAMRYGIDVQRNVAINEVYIDGSIKDATARLWPQTERMKAALAMVESANGPLRDVILAWRGLRQYGLAANPALFRDKLRVDGAFVEEASFASSLYHITCAISELDRVVSRLTAVRHG